MNSSKTVLNTCNKLLSCSKLQGILSVHTWSRNLSTCKIQLTEVISDLWGLLINKIVYLHFSDSFLAESEASVTCSTPTSPNHSILTSFSRVGSVKRKRSDNSNTSFANSSADSDQMDKKRRKENAIRSGSNTPASPQVRRARGEELLPR